MADISTSGPLHMTCLFLTIEILSLPKPETASLAYIRNLLQCYILVSTFIVIILNIRTPSLYYHHHQILYMLLLIYCMLF